MKVSGIIGLFAALGAAHRVSEPTGLWLHSNGTHFTDASNGEATAFRGCDVSIEHGSEHYRKTIQDLAERSPRRHRGHSKRTPLFNASAYTPANITNVATYFHVVTGPNDASTITQAMVNAQIKELNAAYNPYGISFDLINTTWTVNTAWSVGAPAADQAMKTALRTGTYDTINFYFQTKLGGGLLGTCTLPSQVEPGMPPALYWSDGCNVNAHSMPGGSLQGYNMGKTAVHEAGHWFGLLHTFEGYSCSGPGDYVADTPQESVSTSGCPTNPWKNSCPTESGGDPVHNYMDYSTDACYEQFSPDQVDRMADLYSLYRRGM